MAIFDVEGVSRGEPAGLDSCPSTCRAQREVMYPFAFFVLLLSVYIRGSFVHITTYNKNYIECEVLNGRGETA